MFTLLLVITSNLNSALEKEGEEKGKISIDVFTIASFFMLIALFTLVIVIIYNGLLDCTY